MFRDLPPRLRAPVLAVPLLFLVGLPAGAADDADGNPDWFPGAITANVGFTSDYAFRGISQTNEHAAIQGGLDWAADIFDNFGIYAGGWGSNVDFKDGDNAQAEIDVYGGFTGSIGNFSWDTMVLYYDYPGAGAHTNYDFIEFGPTLGYDFGVASVSVNYMWSPNYFAHSGDSHWITGGAEAPVPENLLPSWLGITGSGNIGHQAIDKQARFGVRDYLTWDLGATFSAFGVDLDLRYIDTDLARKACFGGGSSLGDLCDARFVTTLSKSF